MTAGPVSVTKMYLWVIDFEDSKVHTPNGRRLYNAGLYGALVNPAVHEKTVKCPENRPMLSMFNLIKRAKEHE